MTPKPISTTMRAQVQRSTVHHQRPITRAVGAREGRSCGGSRGKRRERASRKRVAALPRSSRTGRTRRRPATAARRAPRRRSARAARARGRDGGGQRRRSAVTAPGRRASRRTRPPPRRSGRRGGCAGISGAQARDAALLRLAAGDPVDRVDRTTAPRRGVGVGRLAVVDEADAADRRDPLLAVRQAREAREAARRPSSARRRRARWRPRGGGGVLRSCGARAGARARAGRASAARSPSASSSMPSRTQTPPAARPPAEIGDDAAGRRAPARRRRRGCGSSSTPITARSRGLLACEDALLGGDVARHVAVAVEMVGRDVEHTATSKRERLAAARAGRTTAPAHRRRRCPSGVEVERAAPILPPTATRPPASARMWPISAVVVDLPLVPVMPTKRGVAAAAAASSSTSPTIGTPAARAARPPDAACGKVCGMPGLEDQRSASRRPVAARGSTIGRRRAAASRVAALSSQASTSTPAAISARAVGEAASAPAPGRRRAYR